MTTARIVLLEKLQNISAFIPSNIFREEIINILEDIIYNNYVEIPNLMGNLSKETQLIIYQSYFDAKQFNVSRAMSKLSSLKIKLQLNERITKS